MSHCVESDSVVTCTSHNPNIYNRSHTNKTVHINQLNDFLPDNVLIRYTLSCQYY